MKKVVLITGVSSGIGLGMAKKFLASDYQVIGSVRSREQADSMERALGTDFRAIVFDLAKEAEIASARATVEEILQGRTLALLVNNAGTAELGPLLHVSLDDFRRQLETLVVGHLAVIQTMYGFLLPTRGAGVPGHIINISSVSGVGSNPFFGAYVAGKHALEGLSKTLRWELQTFGIRVVVVAPGNIGTPIWTKQTTESVERYKHTSYHEALLGLLGHIHKSIAPNAMTIEEFADAFFEVAIFPNPAERYTVSKGKSRRNPFAKAKVRLIPG